MAAEPRSIGEHLVALGAMSTKDAHRVLLRQMAGDSRLFGQIAVDLGYLTEEDLLAYLQSLSNSRIRRGRRAAAPSG